MLFERNKPFTGVLTETEEMFMILPHLFFFISGNTSLDSLMADIIVELKVFCQSSSVSSSKVLGGGPPLLLTNISMEFNSFFAS